MRKTWLVAMREYVENVRTKTFWLGIFALPVFYVVAIVVAKIFAGVKDERFYAVVDHTPNAWFSTEVERRAAGHDLAQLLETLRDADVEDRRRAAEELRRRLEDLGPDHPLRRLIDRLRSKLQDGEMELVDFSERGTGLRDALLAEVLAWMRELSPQERGRLKNLAPGLAIGRYRRVQGDFGPDPEKTLNRKLQDGEIFAYFVIPEDPVHGFEGARYVSNNLTDSTLRRWFERMATDIVREKRIAELKIAPEQAAWINEEFRFARRKVGETGETEEVKTEEQASQFAPAAFVYALWLAVFVAAQMLLTNTVEEKSNRIIEVLLSSLSPFQLMAGKIFGIAATGLTIVLSWALCALVGVKLLPVFFPGMPDLQWTAIIGDPRYLLSFVGYFLGGYFFYAALLVGIGSVCNSLKEAQNLQTPVVLFLIVPIVAMIPVVNDPNGTLARVLTYVPLFTPFLMMNRAAGPPPAWEYALTTVLILASIAIAFWAAGKIFRVGILMTGKPPRLREILRWLRDG